MSDPSIRVCIKCGGIVTLEEAPLFSGALVAAFILVCPNCGRVKLSQTKEKNDILDDR